MSPLRVFVQQRVRDRVLGPHLALLALVGMMCLVGCAPHPPAPPSQTVTSLHVLRTSLLPQYALPPFERTVNDVLKVQWLYNALLALPTAPSGFVSCPADIGITYHLTFSNPLTTVLQATVEEGGCRFAMLSNGEERWANSDTFWMVFADTLGVPESELFPEQPTGPSAPTEVP